MLFHCVNVFIVIINSIINIINMNILIIIIIIK